MYDIYVTDQESANSVKDQIVNIYVALETRRSL